ncbi:hypothetical protein ABE178_15580 [Priestia megaterium]
MSYKFTQQYTEEFEITIVKFNFMKFGTFFRTRKDITSCELCKTDFKKEDDTCLAFVVKKKNLLICNKCADKAVKGGAEKRTEW